MTDQERRKQAESAWDKYQNDPFFHKISMMLFQILAEKRMTMDEINQCLVIAKMKYDKL